MWQTAATVMFLVGMPLLSVSVFLVGVRTALAAKNNLTASGYEDALQSASVAASALIHFVFGTLVFIVAYGWISSRVGSLAISRYLRWQGLGRAAALVMGGLIILWFVVVLRGAPSVSDDLTYFFQAHLFSRGKAMLPVSTLGSLKSALAWFWVVEGDGLYSFQIPGHSLLLALGVWLRAFYVIPVFESMITCYATCRAALLLYGSRTAFLTTLLFLTSPYVLTVFSSYAVSTSVACGVSLVLWSWAAFRRNPSTGRVSILGIAVGFTCWMRPSAAFFVAFPIVVLTLIHWMRGRISWKVLGVGFLAGMVLVAPYVGYCTYVSGHPAISPGDVYWNRVRVNSMSASNILDPDVAKHPFRLPMTLVALLRLNIYLLGWPVSLAALGFSLLLPGKRATTWVLLAASLMLLVFYAFYRSVLGWYYFEAAPLMLILCARGCLLFRRYVRQKWKPWSRWRNLWRLVAAGMVVSCTVTIPIVLTRQYLYVAHFNQAHDFVRQQAANERIGVLLGDGVWKQLHKELLSRNDPFMNEQIIYLGSAAAGMPVSRIEAVIGRRKLYVLHYEGAPSPSGRFRLVEYVQGG